MDVLIHSHTHTHTHTHTHILFILLHISKGIPVFRANCLHRVGDLRMGDMALGKTFNCVHFTKLVLVFSEYHDKV